MASPVSVRLAGPFGELSSEPAGLARIGLGEVDSKLARPGVTEAVQHIGKKLRAFGLRQIAFVQAQGTPAKPLSADRRGAKIQAGEPAIGRHLVGEGGRLHEECVGHHDVVGDPQQLLADRVLLGGSGIDPQDRVVVQAQVQPRRIPGDRHARSEQRYQVVSPIGF